MHDDAKSRLRCCNVKNAYRWISYVQVIETVSYDYGNFWFGAQQMQIFLTFFTLISKRFASREANYFQFQVHSLERSVNIFAMYLSHNFCKGLSKCSAIFSSYIWSATPLSWPDVIIQ